MESQRGKLDSHLSALFHAVERWLEWEDLKTDGEREDYLFALADDGEEAPEPPEPLSNLRRLRRFNFAHLVYSGGLYNQPHIYMREIHTCIEAEYVYAERVAVNLAIQNSSLQDDKE